MEIPALPPPDLDVTLAEISRVLPFIFTPPDIQAYSESVSRLVMSPHAPLKAIIKAAEERSLKNPANSFRSFLLSRRDPLFHSMIITTVLRTPPGDQLAVAGRLLSRLALVASTPDKYLSVSVTGSPGDTEETSLFLGTTRRVGDTSDTLVSTPSSRHVVVWYNGQAFYLDVLNAARLPYSEDAIIASLKEIMTWAGRDTNNTTSVASLSWNLSRPDWFKAREVLETQAANKISFIGVDTALATIALESFNTSLDPAEQIEAVRIGQWSINRYADQVVGLVVFKDGTAGLTVDHAPVDGGIVVRFADQLATVEPTQTRSNTPINPRRLEFILPPSLPSTAIPPPSRPNAVRVLTLDQVLSPTIITQIYKARLVPFMIHMAVQTALSNIPILPLVIQPTSMRHFHGGRSDPSFPATSASLALINTLNQIRDDDIVPDTKLIGLFKEAHLAYKAVIKAVKRGTGVGRYSNFLYSVATQLQQQNKTIDLQPLITVWRRFSGIVGPVVYVTGFEQSPGVSNGMGNLYTNDQLSCWYSGCSDHAISLVLTGTGVFMDKMILDRIGIRILTAFEMLAHIGINMSQ